MYLNGSLGSKDVDKAVALFQRSASQGDDWGLNNLGGMYEMGWSVDKDPQKALDLYKQSWDKGNDRAKENFDRLTALLNKPDAAPATADTIDVQPIEPVQPASVTPPAESATASPAAQGGAKTDGSDALVEQPVQGAVKSDSSAN
jgi:TPR repeat protein